jgi:hypothetical protein
MPRPLWASQDNGPRWQSPEDADRLPKNKRAIARFGVMALCECLCVRALGYITRPLPTRMPAPIMLISVIIPVTA